MKIAEIDGINDSIVERDATPQEIEQLTEAQNAAQAAKEAEEIAAAKKAQAKAALLDRLGITAEDAELLLS